ncbi:hypothetical protein CS0771_31480 [Catellatospora sp. IY07-71]|uniref:hypothetical protein n=1 Tax=Catellatospora sp. IY07-71 TaxID=2728827 RepID=UPI001BB31454|nr:hypothetical protein [Catellatospora sp. IY07-71]BCJ73604.1 hypothetical protein CS0771_31480 [Catellatospora sp. IY07-71]
MSGPALTSRHTVSFVTATAVLAAMLAVPAAASADPVEGPAATVVRDEPCPPPAGFRPGRFEDSTDLDSRYQPLPAGTELTWQVYANDGGQALPRTVVLTATDLVKRIDGVWARVLWQRRLTEGVVTESALVFQAQDDDRGVWQVGAYPELLADGAVTGAPEAWIAGVAGARAGVVVPGDPEEDEPPYLRAEAPGVGLLRCGFVVDRSAREVCAPSICYDGVLVVEEFSPLLAPPVRHSYLPGVGMIAAAQANTDGETLFLTGRRRLSIDDRLAAAEAALGLEERAYAGSEVYAGTEAMRLLAADADSRAVRRALGDRVH